MFRNYRARRLSRNGEHTAALALSRLSDNEVLSRAGMHLTLLEQGDDGSIFAGIAHAHAGNTDRAFEIAARHLGAATVRPLLGQLAAAAPERALALLGSHPKFADLAHYCRIMSGQDTGIVESPGLSPLLVCATALRTGRGDLACQAVERLFSDHGLTPPQLDWSEAGMALHTISHAETPPSEGPLVSIVLTAYNEENCLPLAVNSLLGQSWRNIELVIVNDASTDGTLAVAQALAAGDGRVRIVDLAKNGGLWRAKNAGFAHCSGDFITMHDADDWSHPRKIESQMRPLLANPSLQATTSSFFRVDQASGLPYTRNACNYLRWNPSSLLFRRHVLDEVGNFLDQLLGSDGEFVARIETRYGAQAHHRLRLPLSIGYQRQASLSNRFRANGNGGRAVRLRHWEAWRKAHVEQFKRNAQIRYLDSTLPAL